MPSLPLLLTVVATLRVTRHGLARRVTARHVTPSSALISSGHSIFNIQARSAIYWIFFEQTMVAALSAASRNSFLLGFDARHFLHFGILESDDKNSARRR